MTKFKFYTYEYRDPRNHTPVYVGEGKGRRAYVHLKKTHNPGLATFIAELCALKLKPIIDIKEYFSSQTEAWVREIELIALYGRIITGEGSLFNIMPGGGGMDEETMRRVFANPEYRQRNLEQLQRLTSSPEFRDHLHRISADPKNRQQTSERMHRLWSDLEFQNKISNAARRLWGDPEFQKQRMKGFRRRFADPKYQKEQSERSSKTANNPENLKRMAEGRRRYWERKRQSKQEQADGKET